LIHYGTWCSLALNPNASNTCGGTFTPAPGDTVVTLTGGQTPGGTIATPGFCIVTVNVTIDGRGTFLNALGAGVLVTDQGNNPAGPGVVLNGRSAAIPTLNEWGVIVFMMLAGLGSIFYLRKQKEFSS